MTTLGSSNRVSGHNRPAFARLTAALAAALMGVLLPVVATAGRAGAEGPDAIESLAGCTDTAIPANDDGATVEQPLPFTLNFAGKPYSSMFVGNNGYVTFGKPSGVFTPKTMQSAGAPIIAPFFADVDTRATGSQLVTYTMGGRPASAGMPAYFCINYVNVGYYNQHADKLNSFQLILRDKSGETGVTGDFDIVFNYDKIKWETGDVSGSGAPTPAANGFGGFSARAGYWNGSSAQAELPGSGVNGALLDGSATGLIKSSLNSLQLGRYVFPMRSAPGKIAFQSDRDGNREVYVMNPDGSSQTNLTNNPAVDGFPSISPNGDLIAFESDRSGNGLHIEVMNSDGSNRRYLTEAGTFEGVPAFSPDGSKIAFSSNRTGTQQIFVMNADGSNQTQVTTARAFNQRPTWSPDGSKLAYYSSVGGGVNQIFTINVNGSGEIRIDYSGVNDQDPAWSPDGSTIAFATPSGIWLIDANGANRRALTAGGQPTWAPSSAKLAVSNGGHIWSVNRDGSAATQLTTLGSVEWGPSWADNLTLWATETAVQESPPSVPESDFQTQGRSPNITGCGAASCGSGVQSAQGIQLPSLPGIQLPSLQGIQLPSLPGIQLPSLQGIQLPSLPGIQLPSLGLRALADPSDLGSSPPVLAGLRQISLASIPIAEGWPAALQGTPLANQPIQTVTMADVLALNPVPPVALRDLDLSLSQLGRASLVSLLLGNTRVRSITLPAGETFCGDVTRYLVSIGRASQSCDDYGVHGTNGAIIAGNIGTASLLSLEVAGIPLSAFAGLQTRRMQDFALDGDRSFIEAYSLPYVDMFHSSMGNILVRDLPADPNDANQKQAIDCTIIGVDCSANSTQTIYGAIVAARQTGRYTAVRSGSTFASLGHTVDGLTLAEVAAGLTVTNPGDPYDGIPLAQLGVLGYGGPGASGVRYHVRYAPVGAGSVTSPTVGVVLPADFRYAPGTTSLNGAADPTFEPAASGSTLVWTLPGPIAAGSVMTLDFTARPGLTLGSFDASATLGGSNVNDTVAHRARLSVNENFEVTPTTPDNAPVITPGRAYFSHIAQAGDVDFFKFAAPALPGSRINVYLDHLVFDADLVLYHPLNSLPSTPLRPAASTAPIRAVQDAPVGLNSSAEMLTPESLNDLPLANLPIAAVSDSRGTQMESVSALSWAVDPSNPAAYYTIGVSGYNGAHGDAPYALRVVVTPPTTYPDVARAAFPTVGTPGGPAVVSPTTSYKTVILTNQQRLQAAYGVDRANAAISAINGLAGDPAVQGLVVPVDAYVDVNLAYQAWDRHPGNPELANNIVRLINAHVDSLLGGGRSSVQHIVLGGTDEMIPMGRVPDLTQDANERGFAGEALALTGNTTGGNNALIGGGPGSGSILTDDGYCGFTPKPFLGTWLYPPTVACGRLVETPEDMVAVISQFRTPTATGDASGVLRPAKALTTGYDFMTQMANAINSTLSAQLGSAQSTLINETWSTANLENAYNKATPVPDIAAINAHGTPTFLLPADRTARYTTDELAPPAGEPASNLLKHILFTLACHSGFSITDYLAAPGTAKDFSQASLSQGMAAFVGQTGYGLGSLPGTIGFGEALMTGFAQKITTMTLGQALAQAKLDYLTRSPGVYDYKVLAEATFYGLPMFKIASTATAPPPAAPPAVTTDPTTGFSSAAVSSTNPATSSNWVLSATADGSYYQLQGQPGVNNNGKLAVTQLRPIEPRVDIDVTQPNLTARGALITRLSSSDTTGFDPVLARPVSDSAESAAEAEVGGVTFPAAIQEVTTTPTLTGGQRQQVDLVPAQFSSTGFVGGKLVGRNRRFTDIGATVYYADSNVSRTGPGAIQSSQALKLGSGALFSVRVADANGGPVNRVVVGYHDALALSGNWTFLDLTRSSDDPLLWTAGVANAPANIEFFSEAVDAFRNVLVSSNKGSMFPALTPPAAAAGITLTTTPGSPGVSGWFTGATSVALAGPAGVSFTVRPDSATGNDGQPQYATYSGPVSFTTDGVHTLEWRASNGATGTSYVPIDAHGPSISIKTPPTGIPTYLLNQSVTAQYSCVDALSGLAACAGPVASGGAVNTSAVASSPLDFPVNARDAAGNTASSIRQYRVQYGSTTTTCAAGPGHVILDPIKTDGSSVVMQGKTLPVKFRVCDANGASVSTPGVVRSFTQTGQTSGGLLLMVSIPINNDAPDSGFRWDGDHWHFNMKTDTLVSGTKYTYRITLNDGTYIDFTFAVK